MQMKRPFSLNAAYDFKVDYTNECQVQTTMYKHTFRPSKINVNLPKCLPKRLVFPDDVG